ncbi:CBASS cGAMP-activated phospholipase [Tabrizicola sp.]|uniref:CBASS cGAMP-activated phospholipase n=1 Tax=Tabrizicola sp. TaxID=2005166 RepID=UPI003F2B08DC
MTFNILALSGGGYRGLFTIEVLARLEQRAGRPIGECFDLIAGTSIGGIIAIGLAMGKSAESIKKEFIERGEDIFPKRKTPTTQIGKCLELWQHGSKPKYDGIALRKTVESVLGGDTLIQDAKTRLLVPAINMTAGKVQMFKTPHHERLTEDGRRKAVDVAMATSAAPLFFPLAKMGENYYADGGLAANAPDACAIHEAVHFCDQSIDDLRLISIGTTFTGFGLPTSLGADFGPLTWVEKERILATVMGAQQQLVEYMTGHMLRDRYLRIDASLSSEQSAEVGLDVATPERRGVLLGLAESAFQSIASHSLVVDALSHRPERASFVPVQPSSVTVGSNPLEAADEK